MDVTFDMLVIPFPNGEATMFSENHVAMSSDLDVIQQNMPFNATDCQTPGRQRGILGSIVGTFVDLLLQEKNMGLRPERNALWGLQQPERRCDFFAGSRHPCRAFRRN